MKEKSQILKSCSRSENSAQHKKLKEKHRQMASNSNRNKSETEKYKSHKKDYPDKSTDNYRSVKESNRKKNHGDEINYDESYEELSRKKRKIERELHALDLEEAAAKRQKISKKISKHQTAKEEDKSRNGEKHLASEKNSRALESRASKHRNLSEKDKPPSDENKHLTTEKNRHCLDRKTSKLKHFRDRDESLSDENKHLASGRNRQKPEKKTSRYENIAVKEEPLSDEDRHLVSERNRHRLERRAPRHQNINFKEEEPSSDENGPSERNRSEPSRISKDNEFGSKANAVKDKEKPDFAVSGKLAEDTNVFNGVVIKYNEPSEARKPKRRWRLYPFKGESDLPFIPIHRQSAYLLGRTRAIADIPIDHPSCSKQHAVLQFRLVPYTREDGTKGRRVRPYIIDLESANGTFVNNNRINPRCYVELMEKDVIKFGYSSREYVLLHEESKNDDYDDVRDSS